jgi:hypothetical protein
MKNLITIVDGEIMVGNKACGSVELYESLSIDMGFPYAIGLIIETINSEMPQIEMGEKFEQSCK